MQTKSLALLFTLGSLFFSFESKVFAQKSNLLIYLADDLGIKDVGLYGAVVVKTPTLDKLAKEGTYFKKAYVVSPACAPSRAALLTGLYPVENGAEENHTYPKAELKLMTSHMQENGYYVAAFGKIAHLKMNTSAGFDYYDGRMENFDQNVQSFIDSYKGEKPICLLVGDRRPHVPWIKESIYDPEEVNLPHNFIDTKETREHRARYYTDVTSMDNEMGKVISYLDKKWGNDYLTIFSSDHGAQWPFGKWNLYETGINVPLIIKWPHKITANQSTNAMVSWIDIFPTIFDLLDIPAVENISGRSFKKCLVDNDMPFRNYIYTSTTADGIMNIYPIRAIENKQYKYIKNIYPDALHTNHSDRLRKDGAGAFWDSWDEKAKADTTAARIIKKYYTRPLEEFFDLNNDPDEKNNLINDSTYTTEIELLKSKLMNWMNEKGDEVKMKREVYLIKNGVPDLKN